MNTKNDIERHTMTERLTVFKQTRVYAYLMQFIGLFVIVVVFGVLTNGRIVSFINIKLILKQSASIMVASMGAVFVIAHGNIDFSLGGIIGLAGTLGALAGYISPWLTLPVAIVVGVIGELFVVGVHIYFKIPAFIVSFAMMFLGRGLTATLNQSRSIGVSEGLMFLDTPVFYYFVIVFVALLAILLFNFTKIGKYNRAIGANEQAAIMSGINVNKFKIIAYCICGVALGIAAFTTILRGSGSNSSTGSGMEIEVLLAIVIGGMSLNGGSKMSIRGAIVGAFLLTMLTNGMIMVKISPELTGTVKGMVFLVAVALTYDKKSSQIVT